MKVFYGLRPHFNKITTFWKLAFLCFSFLPGKGRNGFQNVVILLHYRRYTMLKNTFTDHNTRSWRPSLSGAWKKSNRCKDKTQEVSGKKFVSNKLQGKKWVLFNDSALLYTVLSTITDVKKTEVPFSRVKNRQEMFPEIPRISIYFAMLCLAFFIRNTAYNV